MLLPGVALLALVASPARLTAQAATLSRIAPNQQMLVATAQLRLPATQPFGRAAPTERLIAQRARGNKREGEILMIVGAAGIVTGLLVDEDLITIAGAGVAGFGLYLYLEATR
jgi:hypothetical protein